MNHGGTEGTEDARRKLVVNSTPTKSLLFSVAVSVSSVPPWFRRGTGGTAESARPGEPPQPEELDVVPAALVLHQVRHHFADHAAELVAVPGEPGGNQHLGMCRVPVQDEVAVGRVGEHAGLEHERGAFALREIAAREG